MGTGSVWEEGEERAADRNRITKGVGVGRNRK